MKIFEIRWNVIDEKSWVCADTNIEALNYYMKTTSMDLLDFDDSDEIVELPESEWEKHTIDNSEDGEENESFAEYMKKARTTDIIAETIY